MGGKAALLLILGFSLIMLVFGQNFTSISSRSVNNFYAYYDEAQAFNIAVSGANMAANQIFMDKTWNAGYSNLSFAGGTLNVIVSNNTQSNGSVNTSGKTTICHIPPGNPNNAHTISVGNGAVPAHLAHGDYLGPCGARTYDPTIATIVSEGRYRDSTRIVIVQLKPSNFAKFGNYYSSISAMPATGDTFHGPFHANGTLSTYGTPVFLGKVSSKNNLAKYGSPPTPQFLGGYQSGVDIPLEFDTTSMRSRSDKIFKNSVSNKGIDVQLYFNNNGTVTYATRPEGGSWSASTNIALSTLAPNGLIYADKGNIYTKGILDGKVTLVANKNGRNGYGYIYQEDDLSYKVDPRINPSSDDMLGLIATEDIRIKDNANTRGGNVITQASMFSMNGNIGPEDGLVTQNFLGSWHILGGLIAKTTRVTATYSGSNPVKGLRFVHRYDTRFLVNVPPAFPNTKNFEVVSWFE